MNLRALLLVPAIVVLSGCAIHQTVKPMEAFAGKEVCLIENPKVKPGFLDAYRRTLMTKGYAVKQLAKDAAPDTCPITSMYSANWRWDMAMYMSYAEITVFKYGVPSGKATYDATRGGGNMNKFIEADKKITELVDSLFPHTAGS
jgi:hypothetical protein